MERVLGPGGFFFKARDPAALCRWYATHLGVKFEEYGAANFALEPQPGRNACIVFSPFAADTQYFAPGTGSFMVNFRVESLDRMLAQLRAGGVWVDPKVEDYEYGRFGWCLDPEGNKIELWEPAPA